MNDKTYVSDKSINHIIMARGIWKVYVCRYSKQYQCACDIVMCENCYNKNNNTMSQHVNSVICSKQHDMLNTLFNDNSDKAHCE